MLVARLKRGLRSYARYQWADWSGVRPETRQRGEWISLNSAAGTIDFRPRREKDLYHFRDHFLNRFEALTERAAKGENVLRELYDLYDDIRQSFRVRYRANLRTRIRNHFMFI